MRFRISLQVNDEVSGNILPIGYQQQLTRQVTSLLKSNHEAYSSWLASNGIMDDPIGLNIMAVSNLYIPKILVENDRLKICVPRIQFWTSLILEIGTKDFLYSCLLDKEFVIGDHLSAVHFRIIEIEEVSPVEYNELMEYQTLSPIVVKAYRANHTLEFLNPNNYVYSEFMIDELIERWEQFYGRQYMGRRDYRFTLLMPERRKSVPIENESNIPRKVVGYMMKFRLEMSPELQEFAYVTGLGYEINNGFGFIELIRKKK